MVQSQKTILTWMTLREISKEGSWEWKSGTKGTNKDKIPMDKAIRFRHM